MHMPCLGYDTSGIHCLSILNYMGIIGSQLFLGRGPSWWGPSDQLTTDPRAPHKHYQGLVALCIFQVLNQSSHLQLYFFFRWMIRTLAGKTWSSFLLVKATLNTSRKWQHDIFDVQLLLTVWKDLETDKRSQIFRILMKAGQLWTQIDVLSEPWFCHTFAKKISVLNSLIWTWSKGNWFLDAQIVTAEYLTDKMETLPSNHTANFKITERDQ